jgi:hypothetical protein
MKKTTKDKVKVFKFVSETTIRKDHFDFSQWQSLKLREKLDKSIFWIQPTERGKILWNVELLTSYMISGMSAETIALVEDFVASRTQSA